MSDPGWIPDTGSEDTLAAIEGQPGDRRKYRNAAFEMAQGDYIGLMDHDDHKLAPNALFEVVQALNTDPRPEVVYTDEDKVTMDLKEHFQPHLKPDFNLDLLRSNNYICHFFAGVAGLLWKRLADFAGNTMVPRIMISFSDVWRLQAVWRMYRRFYITGGRIKHLLLTILQVRCMPLMQANGRLRLTLKEPARRVW